MSRCLPFPPRGYQKNGLSGAALLENIELERIKHKEKTQKKKEKRDRKHKKSGKSGEGHVGLIATEKPSEDGAEYLDGSDVTAEHEQAVVSGSICCDETHSPSLKRDIEISCHDDIGKKGKIIRIKLPVQSYSECNAAALEFCPTYDGQGAAEQWECEVKQSLANGHSVESSKTLNPISNAIQLSSSGRFAVSAQNQLAKPEPKSTEGRTRSSKSSFEVLMDSWNLLPFQASLPAGERNEDWLFKSDSQPKRLKVTPDESSAYCAPGPHGHSLPDISTYAVPYTVIF